MMQTSLVSAAFPQAVAATTGESARARNTVLAMVGGLLTGQPEVLGGPAQRQTPADAARDPRRRDSRHDADEVVADQQLQATQRSAHHEARVNKHETLQEHAADGRSSQRSFAQRLADARHEAGAQPRAEEAASKFANSVRAARGDAGDGGNAAKSDVSAKATNTIERVAAQPANPSTSASTNSAARPAAPTDAQSAATGSNAQHANSAANAANATRDLAAAQVPTPAAGGSMNATTALRELAANAAATVRPANSVQAEGRASQPLNGVAAPQGDKPRVAAARAASPAAQTEHAASTEPEDGDDNIDRLLKLVRGNISRERSTATLRLDPPELGTVKLRMELRDQTLNLKVETASAAAERLLQRDLDSLRQGLAASGLRLERVEFHVGEAAAPGPHAAHAANATSTTNHDQPQQSLADADGRSQPDHARDQQQSAFDREARAEPGDGVSLAAARIESNDDGQIPVMESRVNVWA